MIAHLVALGGGGSILVDKPVLLIGRHPECDIQIDSRKVSRRHCCLALVADRLVVRDLGSTNGIRINGVRVAEGRLKAGDELMIGSHRYEVRWGAPESGSRPGPVRAAPPDAVPAPPDDEVLEACEEPVPLAEPAEPAGTAEDPPDKAAPAPPKPPDPKIIPDRLELAPASEVLPPAPPAPPPPA